VYGEPDFYAWFQAVTPIDVIARMQIGSRPAVRPGQEGFDALRCNNSSKKKQKYSMQEVSAGAHGVHDDISENAHGGTRRARGPGQVSRATCCGDENGEIVSRRLRAGRSIDGFLQQASPEWEYESRRLPNGPTAWCDFPAPALQESSYFRSYQKLIRRVYNLITPPADSSLASLGRSYEPRLQRGPAPSSAL